MTNREAALKILDDIRDTYSKEPWAQSAIDWARGELNCPETGLRCKACGGSRIHQTALPKYFKCGDCGLTSLEFVFKP